MSSDGLDDLLAEGLLLTVVVTTLPDLAVIALGLALPVVIPALFLLGAAGSFVTRRP